MTTANGPQPGVQGCAAPPRELRLTYIIDTVDTDQAGTENQLLKMIHGFGQAGYRVSLLCLKDHAWLHENADSIGCEHRVIPVHRFRRPGTYINLLRLVGHLRSTAPDIVHTFFPAGNIIGVVAARLAGVPVIISSRRDYGEWMTRGYLRATRFVNRWVSSVVANSTAVKELTVAKEGLPADRVQVVLNGIDPERYRRAAPAPEIREQNRLPAGDRVVGIVANFRPMKHHETFLLAAGELLKTRGDVTFLLVGCGPTMAEMEALAGRLGISGRVVFAGARGDVGDLLSTMDVGVNSSEQEGLSNAIMEYMAAGLPSVVAAAGGNPDLITDGLEGYLFPLGDWRALAALLLKLLDDEQLRAAMGVRAKAKIQREMGLDRMVARYDGLYRRLALPR